MAYANDPSGGRTGPYWRRQLHATLPGERTPEELDQINQLRRKQGLPPLGGPVGENTRFASPAHPDNVLARTGRPAMPAPGFPRPVDPGQSQIPEAGGGLPVGEAPPATKFDRQPAPGADLGGLRDMIRNAVMQRLGQKSFGQGMDEFHPDRNAVPVGGDAEEIRQRLLAQFQGAIQPNYSRDALRNYVQQHMQRRAVPSTAPQRPILPQRTARRAIPY